MNSKDITNRAGRIAGLMSAVLLIGFAFSFAVALPADSTTALPAGVSQNWWAEVQQQIQSSEYDIQYQDASGAYQSPNRAQNLRFTYYPEGFSVRPRTGEDDWVIKLTLSSYGREGEVAERYMGGEFLVYKNRARVSGLSPIAIEYFNDKSGMRQDFIVKEKPVGIGQLRLDLDVVTEGVTCEAGWEEVSFVSDATGGAKVLQYGSLKVTDADGKELGAYFERIGEGQLAIVVDDALARYPVLIDPLATTPNWTAESNQASAYFGSSVASAGHVNGDDYSDVIVGAPYYDNSYTNGGRAFVYHGSSTGLATSYSWTADGGQASACFGSSVASAGDVNGDGYSDVVVGAPNYNNSYGAEGRAFVYHGSSTGLATSYFWTADGGQASAYFGSSVASAGDVNGDGYSDVVIGAPYYSNGQPAEGRAFVYFGHLTSGLSTSSDWTAESNEGYANLGWAVASAGDVNGDGCSDVIIGAPNYNLIEYGGGLVYVYHGNTSTGLSTTPDWTSGRYLSELFGVTVSTAGDLNNDGYSDIIIGAPEYYNGTNSVGKVFAHYGSSSGVSTSTYWSVEGGQSGGRYGNSVAMAGDLNGDGYSDVIIGAYKYSNGQTEEGRAYIYQGSSSGLSTAASWTAESDQAYSYFGGCVASAGDVNGDGYSDVIVGAYGYGNDQTNEGRAFVYQGSAAGLATNAGWSKTSSVGGDHFGKSVASAGDVNGDGYCDVIIGAPVDAKVFVFHGSSSGLSTMYAWTAEINTTQFGYSVASAGDVNGDGFSDVIIGAPDYSNGHNGEGAAYVYYGHTTSGLSTTYDWSAESNNTAANFGNSVATAGDVNGDGYSDIMIGAQEYSNGQDYEGAVFVWYGSATGLGSYGNPLNADWFAQSDDANAQFGYSVASAGDVNGDGYGDVIIGARYYDASNHGRVFVWHGSTDGVNNDVDGNPSNDAWHTLPPEQGSSPECFGWSVASAGDVNGDGFSDIIIGVPHFNDDGGAHEDEGRAFVWHGSTNGVNNDVNGTTANVAWTVSEGNQYCGYFGWFVGSAGDVNGDGYGDVIIGAPGRDNNETDEGQAYVYYGHLTTGLSTTAAWSAENNIAQEEFGYCVATAGDVNGDGYSDVIVGGPHPGSTSSYSKSYLYYGNGGPCAMVLPRQFRSNQTTPIVPTCSNRGGITSTQKAGLSLWGRTYYGRSNVKAQFEVKALGTAFNGSSLNETNWTNVGTAGTNLALLTSALSQWTLYKWRGRIKYSPTLSVQRYSPWYFLSANAMTECDFRTEGLAQQDELAPQVNTEETSVTNSVMIPLLPYPNPFKSFTTIPGYENKEVVVYDLTGRQVGMYNGSRVGEGLTNGIYFVKPLVGSAKPVKLLKVR